MDNTTAVNNSTDYFDLIIVGGGMVGASMALASSKDGFRVALIEAFALQNEAQPSFDERTIALTYSSYKIYHELGVWPDLAQEACHIQSIEVTNINHWGFTHLDSKDVDTDALGYVVATRDLGKALYKHIAEQSNLFLFSPAQAIDCTTDSDNNHNIITIELEENNNKITKTLKAKCTVMADGGRSPLLAKLDLKNTPSPYDQKALVAIVRSETNHSHKAFEHFMSDGPLALLPYRDKDYALVWTAKEQELNELLQLDDESFLDKLQSTLNNRAGKFNTIGNRANYPLSKGSIKNPTHHRLVIIGNAAHIVHPVAGQGFNLGLRDVAVLADVFKQHQNDPGNAEALNKYRILRKRDTKMVSLLTDGLIKTFTSEKKSVQIARNIGLSVINILPPVKRSILKRTMGIHKPSSRLLKTLK